MSFIKNFLFSYEICLQEKAVKWYVGEEIDGLTTNGVFIMKPQEGFYPPGKPGVWREVSVGGAIYPLRESRSAPLKTNQVQRLESIAKIFIHLFKASSLKVMITNLSFMMFDFQASKTN